MRYTLRQLEVFLATAHFENVTKAAQSLSMSQSAASGSLKDLEQQFDIQLFDRIGKRLQVNELGRLLRPKAEALLEQAKELELELTNHKHAGSIKLGATLTIGNYLAVDLMARYMAEVPAAQVSLEVANTESIVRQIVNFELDIGLIEGEVQHPDLEINQWQKDELVVFCSAKHPFATKIQLDDDDLIAADWIMREHGSGTRQAFDRAMHGLIAKQRIALELQHTEAILRAVEAGMGIACLSRIVVQDAVERGSLIILPVPQRDLSRSFYCILHRDKFRTEGINHWLALCS